MRLPRRHAWPEGHWTWPVPVTHMHGVRCGEMIFVGGQVDMDTRGVVMHPHDLPAQTAAAMAHIDRILAELGADLADVVKLIAFYVNDGAVDEALFLADVFRYLPKGTIPPVVTAVPLPALAYRGMVVEIEAVAMRGPDGCRLERQACRPHGAGPFPDGLRCGEMIFVGGQSAVAMDGSRAVCPNDIVSQSEIVMEHIGAILHALGADSDDVVKINNYYVGGGVFEDWAAAARVRARYFAEPGPAATGMPVPRHAIEGVVARSEVIAMRGMDGQRLKRTHVWPDGHWDWPIHMPYKHGIKCGDMIFVGGQVALTSAGEVIAPDDLTTQTRLAMDNIGKVLAGFGATLDDVVKVTSFYEGGASAERLHDNLEIRSQSFRKPGPATTGIPMPYLAYDGMVIEIEVIAMLR